MPPWCRRYCSDHVGAALWRRCREPSRQTGRPAGRWKSGAGAAAIARGWRRPGAESQWRDTRVWRNCGGRCTRVGTDAPCRSTDGRRGRIESDAPCVRSRATWTSDTAGGGLARLLERSRDATGHGRCPASKPRLSWRSRQSRWPGRHPGRTVKRHRNRDPIGAEQEAGGPCRLRHAAVAASDGRATASRGFTQQCGSESSSSKDGGSPSKTNRLTPARAADAAPGAVDSSRFTPTTDAPAGLLVRRGSWPFPYQIDNNAVVDALGGRP